MTFFENVGLTSMSAVAIVPIIVAIVQAVKMVSPKNMEKWAPLISIAIGVVASFIFNSVHMPMGDMIMAGIVYGLSASGLYSGTKTTAHAIKKDNGASGL